MLPFPFVPTHAMRSSVLPKRVVLSAEYEHAMQCQVLTEQFFFMASEYRDDFLTNPRLNLNDEKQFETVAVDKNRYLTHD